MYNSRQACAVESAARMNKHLNIYLTFSSPVGYVNTTSLPILDAILAYKNVRVRNLNISKYAKDTAAADWILEGKLNNSWHFHAHVSDFIRLVR